MQKESMLYGIIGLLAGSLITVFVASNAVNNNNANMMKMMGMREHIDNMITGHEEEHKENARTLEQISSMEGMMHNMNISLQGKVGDEFDKAFLAEMITHHQGAIEMANQAKINAKHQEIKDMAEDIITAQTKEVNQMKDWQHTWGY